MRENDMFADMMDNFGFMQNHSFSVSGGSQRTSYRLSLGYTGEDGILVTDKDKFDRINMSSFLSVDVNKWLTTQLDIRYANSTQNKVEQGGRNGVWGSAMYLPSYHNILPYEQDGIEYPAETSATFVRYGEPRVIKKTNLRTLGRVIISPLKGLKITGEYTYNRITEYNRMYVNKYKYIGFNFTGLLNNVENSRYALTQGFTNYNAINAFANYDFSIGKHDIAIMGGYNQEESHKESQWSQRTDVLLEICRRSPVLPERHPSPTVSMNMPSEGCSTVSITLTTVNICSKPTDATTVLPVSPKTAVSVSSLPSPPDGAFRKKHS